MLESVFNVKVLLHEENARTVGSYSAFFRELDPSCGQPPHSMSSFRARFDASAFLCRRFFDVAAKMLKIGTNLRRYPVNPRNEQIATGSWLSPAC